MTAALNTSSNTGAAEVVVEHVHQQFGHSERAAIALDDVSVTAPAGRITALVGPSGCGKSTLLDIVAGLESPVAGTVRHGERKVERAQSNVSMAFQQPALLPWLSVRDNIALGLRSRGASSRRPTTRSLACSR